MRNDLSGSTILVTGASSGIGREMVRIVARKAKALVLVARRQDRLEALQSEILTLNPGLRVLCISADLSKQASIDQLLQALSSEKIEVDHLINNAGLGDFTPLEKSNWNKLEQMISTNVVAPVYLAHRLLEGMLRRGRGGILNVGSTAGMLPIPYFSAYCGTKYFMSGFSQSLRCELAGTNVTVTELCPGPVATEFESIAGENIDVQVPKWVEISAPDCARAAISGFEAGRARVIPGASMKVGMFLMNFVPLPVTRLFQGNFAKVVRRKYFS